MATLHEHCLAVIAKKFPALSWQVQVRELGGGRGQTVTIAAEGFSIILSDDDFGFTLLGWICNDRLASPPYILWIEAVSDFFGRPSIGKEPEAVRLDQKKEWFEGLFCDAVWLHVESET